MPNELHYQTEVSIGGAPMLISACHSTRSGLTRRRGDVTCSKCLRIMARTEQPKPKSYNRNYVAPRRA